MCCRRAGIHSLGLYVELSPMERAGTFASPLQPMGITRSWAENLLSSNVGLNFLFFSFFLATPYQGSPINDSFLSRCQYGCMHRGIHQ